MSVYCDHLTVRSTCERHLLGVRGASFKLAVNVLVKYLTQTLVYLDVYVTIYFHSISKWCFDDGLV